MLSAWAGLPGAAGAVRRTAVAVGAAAVRLESDGARVVRVDLLPWGSAPQGAAHGPADPLLAAAAREVALYLRGRLRNFTVPFAQPGSGFQARVWGALGDVEYGGRITYGRLAALAGSPRAARAVGTAMNRNRLPLLVPCHRVVAADGVGGFGCGPRWKSFLLDLEARG